MIRVILIVTIALTIVSCKSSKTAVNIEPTVVNPPLDTNYPWGSENPWGTLEIIINGHSVIDTAAMATRVLDKDKQKSKFSLQYRDDTTDIDNKLRIELSLIFDLMEPQIPEKRHSIDVFSPSYQIYTYVESRNGFKLNNYIPLTGSFNISKSERITSTGFKVSGDFSFSSVSKKTNDTVNVEGKFHRVGYGYVYSDIDEKYIESSKEK